MAEKIPIFYLEDELEDALSFAELVAKVLKELCPTENDLKDFLSKHGIDWYTSCRGGMAALGQRKYEYFILDIFCEGEASGGFAIAKEIYRHREYRLSHVWIISHFPYFKKKTLVEYHADRFFCKSHPQELERELEWIFRTKEDEPEGEYLEIYNSDSKKMDRIKVDCIICASVNCDQYVLWLYNEEKCAAEKSTYYEESRMMKSILRQAREKNITKLCQIDRNHMINTEMVVGIRNIKGVIYIKMRHVPDKILVSRRGKKMVQDIFNKVLPEQ